MLLLHMKLGLLDLEEASLALVAMVGSDGRKPLAGSTYREP